MRPPGSRAWKSSENMLNSIGFGLVQLGPHMNKSYLALPEASTSQFHTHSERSPSSKRPVELSEVDPNRLSSAPLLLSPSDIRQTRDTRYDPISLLTRGRTRRRIRWPGCIVLHSGRCTESGSHGPTLCRAQIRSRHSTTSSTSCYVV